MPTEAETRSKHEIEESLKEVALDGLCNIYHVITGKRCKPYVALGMATSAVSSLLAERDKYKRAYEDLSEWHKNNP